MGPIERVVNYLTPQLDGIRVAQDAPANTKSLPEYVLVARTGGYSHQFLDIPRFTIDCHSTSGKRAYDLADRVKDLLFAMPDVDDKATDVDVSSFYRDDWMDGYPCYSLHVQITFNV